jgi:putative ABC transport system permease protein
MFVPFTFSTTRYNWPTWYSVTATTKSRDSVEEAKAEIEFYLRQVRRLKPTEEPNFRVDTAARAVDEINELAGVLTTVAGGIVAISLLVGGIGIMNIMLVSVTERTREIGIRLAIGALEKEVLLQFLVEAVTLAALGGITGIALATVVSILLANMMKVPYLFSPGMNLLSFVFSAAIGILFGFFPARRAAQLDPIEALRRE